MTTKACVVCGGEFTPLRIAPHQITCSAVCRRKRRNRQRVRAQPVQRNCLRCGDLLPPRTRATGNRLYCGSVTCRAVGAPVATSGEKPCENCGRPFSGNRRARFCSANCRKQNHMAKFASVELEPDGEIPVADLEESPRRLAVAKLFDLFDCGGAFDHFTPAQWMNPADRRASR